ncbi:disease resistance RGA4-like protein, putative [Medicago truncatula]|uniref:Disease resistance RGA4-like protein, putative n=1 Tax=Medicago truncatula TaxID=3880 RepID=A0A072UI15_MEDTR|nr:disease resistance RGA4-like protein, putative [Medicago truncatula]
MAEQIPHGVAQSLINGLASVALREFGRINNVKDELESLTKTVESIRAALLDAENKQEKSLCVQNWVTRLKDVLVAADDLIDEFLLDTFGAFNYIVNQWLQDDFEHGGRAVTFLF